MDAPTPNQSAEVNSNAVPVDANNEATNPDNQSSSASTRGKTDPAWKYFNLKVERGKPKYTCLLCLKEYKGGGINRMKQHLAGKTGNIAKCMKVPHDVKEEMLASLEEIKKNKCKDDSLSFGDEVEEAFEQEEQEVNRVHPPSKVQVVGDKGKQKAKVSSYFAARSTPGGQPSLKSAFQSKEALHEVDLRVARWFVDARIPFNAI